MKHSTFTPPSALTDTFATLQVDLVLPPEHSGHAGYGPTLTHVCDNRGADTGVLANGARTDDATPQLWGNASPNATVSLYDNGGLLGTATADPLGHWQYTPSLQPGPHRLLAKANGQSSDPFELLVEESNEPMLLAGHEPLFAAPPEVEPDSQQWANLHASLQTPSPPSHFCTAPASVSLPAWDCSTLLDDISSG